MEPRKSFATRDRHVFDAVRDAIIVVDIDAETIVDANRAAESLYGWTFAELRSLHHSWLFPSDIVERARRGFDGYSRQDSALTEGTVQHKDGHRIPVEIGVSYFADSKRRRLLIGIFRDCTERNAIQERLRRSEERFRQFAESVDKFIWEVDPAGLYVFASRAVERFLGYSPEEIIGKLHFYDLFVPELREQLKNEAFETFTRQGLLQACVNWNIRKDGSVVALEMNVKPIRDANGRLYGYRGAAKDVTERKQAEAALRQSEKIYRAIGDSIDYGVWTSAPDGRNTYVSESFQKLVGLTLEQCSNFGWAGVLHPDDAEQTIAAWNECVRTEGRWEVEHRYRGVDGEWHPILSRGVPVRDEFGRITGWTGINLDISVLKRTEERLLESERQAKARTAEMQAIMDAAPAAIFVAHDPECCHISGNRTAQGLLRQDTACNFSMTALGGERRQKFRVMRDGIDIPLQELPLRLAARTGQPVRNCEVEIVFDDGSSLHFLGNAEPMLDDTGQPRGAVAVLSDITERKQAEAALREREDRFRYMAETAPVMFWASGPDKQGTFFNKRWLDFAGRTMEQEIGEGWFTRVHPDDRQRLAICADSFHARRSFQIEFRMRRADGEYRWLLDSGVPRYRDGEFTGFIGSCIDVTEQKAIEERLRANECQFKDAQRLAKTGSWEELASGKLNWSDEMFRIFGLPTGAEPDFSTFINIVHPKDREIVLKTKEQAASSTAPVHTEFRIVRPDGDVRFVRVVVQAIRDEQGETIRFLGATQDITDQVTATELLRESEKHLRNAERIAHVGNWRWDIKADRVIWSEELYRIFGTPPNSRAAYEQFIQIVVPQERERVDQWLKGCLSGACENSVEFQIARPDGDLRAVACIVEVSRDESGSPLHVSGTCQDVTDSRRAQAEAFARQKLESLGTLASGIAHDFNNLLGAVLVQAELALSELADGSQPEAELQQIRNVALHGAEIVNQLMIYGGKESQVVQLVDVSRTVKEMLDLLRVSVSKHAVLETSMDRNLPPVRANASHIRQIVMNLVTNASEAIGDRDGVIRVSTRRVTIDKGMATAKGVADGDYVQLEVADTGCGMTPETQARVFDPFFTTKGAGRGLGLGVIHGIVRDLHGAIDLLSERGKGTTIQILLPCAEAGHGVTVGPISRVGEPVRAIRAATVLVIEDEDALRQAVAKLLRKTGLHVLEAADGSAAIEILRTNGPKIDAILLDMTIPGHSSQDVLDEVGRIRPDLKIILTSAYSEQSVTATLTTPLSRRFIRKPFQLNTLMQMLQEALSP